MKYENPELLERLAAEHVLGTLRGAARRRYERLCLTSAAARAVLERWEDHWAALSGTLEPIQPSARVWANVSRQLFAARPRAPRAWRRRTWQLAVAAGLVAVALFIGLMLRAPVPPPQTLAVLGTDTAHPMWRLERRGQLGPLTIRVVGPVQSPSGRAYELWALPRGGRPISLGLLPARGTYQRTLTAAQRAALLAAEKVAVSVEPSGGSPTGSPTGPIIIVADLAVPS